MYYTPTLYAHFTFIFIHQNADDVNPTYYHSVCQISTCIHCDCCDVFLVHFHIPIYRYISVYIPLKLDEVSSDSGLVESEIQTITESL